MNMMPSQSAAPRGSEPFLQSISELKDLIVASAEEMETIRRLPEPVVSALLAKQFYRMLLPTDLKGVGLNLLDFMEVIESLAAIDASTAWCIGQTSGCSLIAAYLPEQGAKDIFVDDPRGVLAWGPGPGIRATIVRGGYRVTGEVTFLSGGLDASWIGCICPIFNEEGAPLRDDQGSPITRHMLFRATEGQFNDVWHVMGLKGTGSNAFRVTDVFVPQHHSASRDNQADRRNSSPNYSFPVVSMFAASFSCIALGVARAMLTDLIELARTKTPRGLPHPMAASPAVQSKIARCEARLASARQYLFATVGEAWRNAGPDSLIDLDRRVKIRLAASHAMAQATSVVDEVYHAAGATSVFASNGFERKFRDMHAITQQVQAREAHFETVGSYLLGGHFDTAFL